MIEISPIEVLALKKLALINHALASALSDPWAAKEQLALTKVLVDVAGRAGRANDAKPVNDCQRPEGSR